MRVPYPAGVLLVAVEPARGCVWLVVCPFSRWVSRFVACAALATREQRLV